MKIKIQNLDTVAVIVRALDEAGNVEQTHRFELNDTVTLHTHGSFDISPVGKEGERSHDIANEKQMLIAQKENLTKAFHKLDKATNELADERAQFEREKAEFAKPQPEGKASKVK